MNKIYSLIFGILDVMGIAFILLPLYGNPVGGYIYSVNLLSFLATTPINLTIYWIVFIAMIGIGIAKLLFIHFEMESWSNITTKASITLSIVAILFFAAAKEPYAIALLFLLFVMKILILMK